MLRLLFTTIDDVMEMIQILLLGLALTGEFKPKLIHKKVTTNDCVYKCVCLGIEKSFFTVDVSV